ncbi:ABC transporter substrate-binding protein [Nocardiopsis sp. RSe5-2]|uniref:ABC transporter substrate-binding protein n=1 Tax=Nocardiopsis endophytica TaxID=3018445 RepID=A0ABT4U519_9ACTN|nr:ABC transporter substrate-binding protein [Nocardiopsis endophytica]MDA2812040.1 ABC transporter substrate-binding protein [Nocardiopsis endophytica]
MTPFRARGLLAAGAAAATLAATACGGGASEEDGAGGDGAPEVQADEEVAALVPDDVAEQGSVTVGVDASYAPGEFLDADGSTVIGFNVDLFDAVAAKMGIEANWEASTFGTIVEGVDSGKYDVGVSSFTINAERMEQVDMVSYYTVGTQWFTAAGNPEGVDPDDACGMTVAVQANTVQVEDIEARSEACEEAGDPAIQIDQYERQDQATQSIVSGKSDAGLADMPVAVYAVEQTDGQLETLGEQYEAAPYGAVVNKENEELTEAIRAGYQSIIDDGTYDEILAEWDLADQGTIEKAEINPDVEE